MYNRANSERYNTSYYRRDADARQQAYRAETLAVLNARPMYAPLDGQEAAAVAAAAAAAAGKGPGAVQAQAQVPVLPLPLAREQPPPPAAAAPVPPRERSRVPAVRPPPCSAEVATLSARELRRAPGGAAAAAAAAAASPPSCAYVHLKAAAAGVAGATGAASAAGGLRRLALLADQGQPLVTLRLVNAAASAAAAAACPTRVPLDSAGAVAFASLRAAANAACGAAIFGADAALVVLPQGGGDAEEGEAGGAELRLSPEAPAAGGVFHRASLLELLERAAADAKAVVAPLPLPPPPEAAGGGVSAPSTLLAAAAAAGGHVALLAGLPPRPPLPPQPQPLVPIDAPPMLSAAAVGVGEEAHDGGSWVSLSGEVPAPAAGEDLEGGGDAPTGAVPMTPADAEAWALASAAAEAAAAEAATKGRKRQVEQHDDI